MIQRIQTVYLALGAVALLAMPFVGALWEGPAAAQYAWFVPTGFAMAGLAALTALVGMFLYKDRKQQRKVVLGAQILTVLFMLVMFVTAYFAGSLPRVTGTSADVRGIIQLLLPVVAYILFLLARRGIESDIKLVKSMDRLR
jgi:glucose uptake protein GlcU